MKSDTGAFALIPEWVLNSGVSDRALRLYAVLGRYADIEGECWPSRRTLAERLGCSSDSVDRAKHELLELGALTWHQQTDGNGSLKTNLYTLVRAAPVRLPSRKTADTPSRNGAAENESHLEREPLGDLAAVPAAPDPKIGDLVSGYVDDYRAVSDGHDPPRSWRGSAGKAIKSALKDGEAPDDIAICLGLISREGKNPSTLAYVLSDMHANRPRRALR